MFPFILPHFLCKLETYNNQVLLLTFSLKSEHIGLSLVNCVGRDFARVVDAKHSCHFALVGYIKRGQELCRTPKLFNTTF